MESRAKRARNASGGLSDFLSVPFFPLYPSNIHARREADILRRIRILEFHFTAPLQKRVRFLEGTTSSSATIP